MSTPGAVMSGWKWKQIYGKASLNYGKRAHFWVFECTNGKVGETKSEPWELLVE